MKNSVSEILFMKLRIKTNPSHESILYGLVK